MIEPVFIYAYKIADIVLYVGSTVNPRQRFPAHFYPKNPNQLPMGGRFRILRTTNHPRAFRVEHQIIRAYKKRGQCKFNTKHTANERKDYCRNGLPVVWVETGGVFRSVAQAARFVKRTPWAVNLRMKFSGSARYWNDGQIVTLKFLHGPPIIDEVEVNYPSQSLRLLP